MVPLTEFIPEGLYATKPAIVTDVIILAVLVIAVVQGIKKGFFKSLMGFVVLGVAVFAAVTVSDLFTDTLTEKLAPKVENKVTEAIANANLNFSGINTEDVALSEDHPDTLSDAEMAVLLKNEGFKKVHDTLEKANVKEPQIRSIFAKALKKLNSGSGSLENFLSDAARTVSHAAVKVTVEILLLIVTFALASILLKLLVNALRDLMYRWEFLKGTDRFLGVVFGLAAAAAVLILAEYIAVKSGWQAYDEALPHTLLAAFLHKHNLISLFLA